MNIERKCWSCKEPGMEPHAPITKGSDLWYFKCPHCGAHFQWVLNPDMDGSYAEKHKSGGGFSISSMMSDPDLHVFDHAELHKMRGTTPKSRRTAPPPGKVVDMEMPDEYAPGEEDRLEASREPMYGIGHADQEGGFGIADGLCPDLQVMLDVIPDEDRPAFIIYFDNHTDELLYRWHRGRQAWIKLRK